MQSDERFERAALKPARDHTEITDSISPHSPPVKTPAIGRIQSPISAGTGSTLPWIQGSIIIKKYAIESTGSYFRDPHGFGRRYATQRQLPSRSDRRPRVPTPVRRDCRPSKRCYILTISAAIRCRRVIRSSPYDVSPIQSEVSTEDQGALAMKQQSLKSIHFTTIVAALCFFMGSAFSQETQDKEAAKKSIQAASIMVVDQGRFLQLGIGLPKGYQQENSLEVNGTILAKEILVKAKVADYVFSPAYDLKSIDYVEEFIQQHHHLPGIPSELAIIADGGKISVGDSYRLLLEKIEELTLYTIAQNKRITELEATVERLTGK